MTRCLICGVTIFESHPAWDLPVKQSWLESFRAIYSTSSNYFISLPTKCDSIASLVLEQAALWSAATRTLENIDDGQQVQRTWLEKSDVIFIHDACWQIFEAALKPQTPSIPRLLDIGRSLPFSLTLSSRSWDHDYEGLLVQDFANRFPWEGWFVDRESFDESLELANPQDVPQVQDILDSSDEFPFRSLDKHQTIDCFTKLPWEVLTMIARCLSTGDALSMRLASTTFYPLISNRAFWLSRFEVDGECGSLFEIRKHPVIVDYRSAFRASKTRFSSPELLNRARVWKLAQRLREVHDLDLAQPDDFEHGILAKANFNERSVAGNIKSTSDRNTYREGCVSLTTCRASICSMVVSLRFCFIPLGRVTYICGMQLQYRDKSIVNFGYSRGNMGMAYSVRELQSLVVAVGPRGVRAINAIYSDGSSQEWTGSPLESPINGGRLNFIPGDFLDISFDGFKIVALAFSKRVSEMEKLPSTKPSLRQAAVWYPSPPSTNLQLNDASFTWEFPHHDKFRPFIWTYFGGQAGCNLPHLTGLSIFWYAKLVGIRFRYDDHWKLPGPQMLGACGAEDPLEGTQFELDGAGGERISDIQVGVARDAGDSLPSFMRHGILKSIKLRTNRGRTLEVGEAAAVTDMRQLEIAPGSALTGLYSTTVSPSPFHFGITSTDQSRIKYMDLSVSASSQSVLCDEILGQHDIRAGRRGNVRFAGDVQRNGPSPAHVDVVAARSTNA